MFHLYNDFKLKQKYLLQSVNQIFTHIYYPFDLPKNQTGNSGMHFIR